MMALPDAQADRLLTTLLEQIPDYIYFKDRERRFVVASNAFCDLLGRSMAEIIGKRDEDLFPIEIAEDTVRDDREVIASGAPIINKLEGGAGFGDTERWVLTTKIPWRDEAGAIIGLFGISKEITDRKRAEDALHASHVKGRALLEAIPDLMFRMSRDGVLLDFHAHQPGELYVPPEDFLGRTVDTVLPTEIARLCRAKIAHTLDSDRTSTFEYSLTLEGGERHYEARMVPSGEADQVIVLVRDTTDRHRSEADRRTLEAQLQHAQKLESLGVLAGGIAHDFNNLLTSILGGAELGLLVMPPDAPARRHIETCHSAALRAADLTQQLLAYAGGSERKPTLVDLAELVLDTQRLMAASLSREATVELDLPQGHLVQADVTQLRQVLMNVLLNASDALGNRPGTVRVACGSLQLTEAIPANRCAPDGLAVGPYAFLEVSDTGCGMERDTLTRVFDPFFTTKARGHGLGMSVVLGIVSGHGGGITIASTPAGGTRVRILLPVCPPEVEGPDVPEAVGPLWRHHGTALVVDDDAPVRHTLSNMLAGLGFEVLTAAHGREGVECFAGRAHEIDVVVLDVTMPVLSGPAALREMRQIRSDIPVIFLSGYAPDLSAQLADLRRVELAPKPITMHRLAELLQRLLEPAAHPTT